MVSVARIIGIVRVTVVIVFSIAGTVVVPVAWVAVIVPVSSLKVVA